MWPNLVFFNFREEWFRDAVSWSSNNNKYGEKWPISVWIYVSEKIASERGRWATHFQVMPYIVAYEFASPCAKPMGISVSDLAATQDKMQFDRRIFSWIYTIQSYIRTRNTVFALCFIYHLLLLFGLWAIASQEENPIKVEYRKRNFLGRCMEQDLFTIACCEILFTILIRCGAALVL